jgi:hypothetical protein
MSEGADYSTSCFDHSHDFGDARRTYDAHVGRSYGDAVSSGKSKNDLLPKSLKTDSDSLLVISCDETGSMGEWPKTIFSKLPYLDHEARTEYLSPDVVASFSAFGDARNGEDYPVQARPFAKKGELKKRLLELVIEGKGGANIHESAELAMLYYATNVEMPKATKSVFILITDEKPYDSVTPNMAAAIHVDLKKTISTKEIVEQLRRKFSVYLILKPYGDGDPSTSAEVRRTWLRYLNQDHIADLADPERVVDVIFGILAQESGRVDYFHKEIEERQRPDQVETVYKSLKTIHVISAEADKGRKTPRGLLPAAGKSTMFKSGGGKKSDDLA